jgi:tetratricopeptide (TPR) repeat protein
MNTKYFQILTIFALVATAGNGYAQSGVSERLPNIDRLLNQSSGARQIIDSGNQAAQEKREQALDAFRQAQQNLDAGDERAATQMLGESARLMFEAIKLATPTSLGETKKISNYEQRRESVVSLQQAFNRISDENNETESRNKVNRQLAELVKRADLSLERGDNAEARTELDKAYHLLKVSIESIRSGQTLVRSLQFESKEDEYHYEIDRNDTHTMLVGLLIGEKQKSEAVKSRIVEYVSEASLLRQQAETFASQNAHEQAIELLEQSTRQLVRAIRSAGIYIPG